MLVSICCWCLAEDHVSWKVSGEMDSVADIQNILFSVLKCGHLAEAIFCVIFYASQIQV